MKAEKFTRNEMVRKLRGAKAVSQIFLAYENEIAEIVRKFDGKKTVKADGTLTKTFSDAINPIREKMNRIKGNRAWFRSMGGAVYLNVKIWIVWESFPDNPHRCDDGSYHEEDFFLFNFDKDGKAIFDAEKMVNNSFAKANKYLNYNEQKCIETYNEAVEQIEKIRGSFKEMPYFFNINLPYPHFIN